MKYASAPELTGCIRAVFRGQPALHPQMAKRLMECVRNGKEKLPKGKLTEREQEVLIPAGKGDEEDTIR